MVSLEQDAYKHMVYGDLEPLLIETKNNFSQIELITMVPRVSSFKSIKIDML